MWRALWSRLSQQHDRERDDDVLRRSKKPFIHPQNEIKKYIYEDAQWLGFPAFSVLTAALLYLDCCWRPGLHPSSSSQSFRLATRPLSSTLLTITSCLRQLGQPSFFLHNLTQPPNFAHFYPQNGDRWFFRNDSEHVPEYTASHPRTKADEEEKLKKKVWVSVYVQELCQLQWVTCADGMKVSWQPDTWQESSTGSLYGTIWGFA